jgi:hypothetical protein
MKEFEGFKLPYGLPRMLPICVSKYNRECITYCANGCEGIRCSECICNSSVDNSVDAIQAFGDYARMLGKDVHRASYKQSSNEHIENLRIKYADIVHDAEEYADMIVKTCAYCGTHFMIDADDDDRDLCDDCQDNYDNGTLRVCDECGGYCEEYVITRDSDECICEDCVDELYRCEDCEDYFRYSSGMQSDDDIYVCDNCYYDSWGRCEDCGCLIHDDNTYWHGDNRYCSCCYDNRHCPYIHEYGYKPDPDFRKTDSDGDKPVYLGFELEAGDLGDEDDRNYTAEKIDNLTSLAYMKEDGSIPNYGFELVTHPLTYLYHKDKANWAEILRVMDDAGMKSHDASDSCGLHVHVSRNALTDTQWVFVDWFVHHEQEIFERIARRKDEYYAKFKKKQDGVSVKDTYGKGYDRYSAVNFCNRRTVEFRLFRGTLRYETLIGTLAIVDALVIWAKTIHARDIFAKGAWSTFLDVIRADEKYTPALDYLKYRNIIND